MCTGLIEALGLVEDVQPSGAGRRLTLSAPSLMDGTQVGNSVSINGACLTVVEARGDRLSFEAEPEALPGTNLRVLHPRERVHLGNARPPGNRLSAHPPHGPVYASTRPS